MKALRSSVLRLLLFVALLSSHAASAQFSQQGPKLVGADTNKPSEHGYSVALSADGNTALVGGAYDNPSVDQYDTPTGTGAAWVYPRSVTAPLPNVQGLWWADPPGSQSGWGVNFTHQGDIIFFT